MSKKLEDLLTLTDEDLFCHYNEGEPEQASQNARDTYSLTEKTLEDYIAVVSEEAFAKGFRYAVKLMKEGAV